MSPHKTKIGITRANFFGHGVDQDGHRHSDRNLDPIAKCQVPQNPSELRTALGMFVQGMKRIEHYAIKTVPLHALLRKGAEWKWRDEVEGAAFESLRKELLEQRTLHKPDYSPSRSS